MDANSNKAPQQGNNTLAILSLVFSFLFAPAGLILGIIALAKKQSKGLAITSIVLSGMGSLILFFIFAISVSSSTQINTADTNTTVSKAAEEAKKQTEADAVAKKAAEDKVSQNAISRPSLQSLVTVGASTSQMQITTAPNAPSITGCEVKINAGIISSGYTYKISSLAPEQIINYSDFTKKGERFDYHTTKPEHFIITCNINDSDGGSRIDTAEYKPTV
ncbi:MAG TPA: DUF4190 domain-containing protein [Candidatus Saccharibacteria bacterium]|jgi:hypothetical protein|nr:DUF4190 domain-containing protein [Candidatus Saccharibacteria bacterium]